MESEYIWVIAVIIIITVIFKFGKNQTPLSSATDQDIQDALKAGKKILAIKYYRVINNCGLTEARQAIDAMDKKL